MSTEHVITTGRARRLSRTGVVLLNWRDAEGTSRCLDLLLTTFDKTQIIVVDNESDGSLAITLRESRTSNPRIVSSAENRGFAAGVNLGIAEILSQGFDYVLLINNDTILKRDDIMPVFDDDQWPENMGAVAPVIRNSNGSVQSAGATVRPMTMAVMDHAIETHQLPIHFLTWACVVVRASVFEKIGLLDERFFMYWEDVDFGMRMTANGYGMTVAPGASIVHLRSGSHTTAGVRIDRYQAFGAVAIARKYRGTWRVGLLVRIAARVVRRLSLRRWSASRAVIDGAMRGRGSCDQPAYLQEGLTR